LPPGFERGVDASNFKQKEQAANDRAPDRNRLTS